MKTLLCFDPEKSLLPIHLNVFCPFQYGAAVDV